MSITLINSFTVPPDKEDDFLQAWRGTIDYFANAPGFIQARLHRNTGLNDTTFQYVNVALWEDVEAYRAVFRNFTPAGQRIPGVTAYPGLFEVHVEINANRPPTSDHKGHTAEQAPEMPDALATATDQSPPYEN